MKDEREPLFPDNLRDVTSQEPRGLQAMKPFLRDTQSALSNAVTTASKAESGVREFAGKANTFANSVIDEAQMIARYNLHEATQTVASSVQRVRDGWQQFIDTTGSIEPDWQDTNDLASIEPRGIEAINQVVHRDTIPALQEAVNKWVSNDSNLQEGIRRFAEEPEETPFIPYTVAHAMSVLERYEAGEQVDPGEWVSVSLLPVAAASYGWGKLPRPLRVAIETAPLGAAVACGAHVAEQKPTRVPNVPALVENTSNVLGDEVFRNQYSGAKIWALSYGTEDGSPSFDQQVETIVETKYPAMGGANTPGSEIGLIFKVTLVPKDEDPEETFYLAYVPPKDVSSQNTGVYDLKIVTVDAGSVSLLDTQVRNEGSGHIILENAQVGLGVEVDPADSSVTIHVNGQRITVPGGNTVSPNGDLLGSIHESIVANGAQIVEVGLSNSSGVNESNGSVNGLAESGAMPTFTPDTATATATSTPENGNGGGSTGPDATPTATATAVPTERPVQTFESKSELVESLVSFPEEGEVVSESGRLTISLSQNVMEKTGITHIQMDGEKLDEVHKLAIDDTIANAGSLNPDGSITLRGNKGFPQDVVLNSETNVNHMLVDFDEFERILAEMSQFDNQGFTLFDQDYHSSLNSIVFVEDGNVTIVLWAKGLLVDLNSDKSDIVFNLVKDGPARVHYVLTDMAGSPIGKGQDPIYELLGCNEDNNYCRTDRNASSYVHIEIEE